MKSYEIRMQCNHCEMETTFRFICEFSEFAPPSPSTDEPLKSRRPVVATKYRIWRVFLCLTCLNPTLEWEDQFLMPDHAPIRRDPQVLYPVPRAHLDNVPAAIEKEYRSAHKYKNRDPNACAVYIGRALDKICQHEKVTGNRLIDKLNNLIAKKNLPDQLGTMAHQIRQIRNMGAHADGDDEVTEADAPIMLDFLEAILEYLYVAPAKIAAVQARLAKTP